LRVPATDAVTIFGSGTWPVPSSTVKDGILPTSSAAPDVERWSLSSMYFSTGNSVMTVWP